MSFSFFADTLFGYTLNKVELIAFVLAFLNAFFITKPRPRSIAISAGVMACGLALGDTVHANVIGLLEPQSKVYFWYLTWALFSLCQAFIVVMLHWGFGVMFSHQVRVLFITMAFNAFLNILMFIDRNIFALNFKGSVNESASSSWFLWDFYTVAVNANLWFLVFVLFSFRPLRGKFLWMVLLYLCCWLGLSL